MFRIATLEDWTDFMDTGMEISPIAWIFFVSFIVIGTFVIIKLFIAVAINNIDEAKAETLKELRQSQVVVITEAEDTLKEFRIDYGKPLI